MTAAVVFAVAVDVVFAAHLTACLTSVNRVTAPPKYCPSSRGSP